MTKYLANEINTLKIDILDLITRNGDRFQKIPLKFPVEQRPEILIKIPKSE